MPKGGGAPSVPQTDYFGALNAFQDPNIGGAQPGSVAKGYGGFGALDTMGQIKMNDYLNTLPVGGERERAMNALGYNNGGTPYTPQVGKGVNRAYRGAAKTNQQTGAYSEPGIYQHQDAAGNYVGITDVGQNLAASFTPFDINRPGAAGGGGRLRPRTPNLGMPERPQLGMPHTQIGQQGKGTGAGKLAPKGALYRGDPMNGVGKFAPGTGGKQGGKPVMGGPGGGASIAKPGAFPAAPPQVPNFLPMTPGYEAAYRGANDQLAGAEGAYAASGALIPAQIAQQRARLDTDQNVATDRLKEQLAERGIYTPYGAGSTAAAPQMADSPAGGGVGEALYNRQVATPFGRSRQDLGGAAADAYQGRALEYGGAQLGFNQAMFDALLGRAGDAFEAMPLSLPIGGYELPEMAGPSFSAPPNKGGGGKPGRNRNRNGNRNRGRGKRGRGRN